MPTKITQVTPVTTDINSLFVSPTQVMQGEGVISQAGETISRLGKRPLVVGGKETLGMMSDYLKPVFQKFKLTGAFDSYAPDCSETSLKTLSKTTQDHQADLIIGVGGGKALDTAKLLAHQQKLPIVTIPTSGATCAAWRIRNMTT